ncbi:MAG: ribosome biogenesis GTPase Der [Bacteroidota bacterium]|nr:ribosome biogenesis GTPase Der [Bacteroidota bacterium]
MGSLVAIVGRPNVGKSTLFNRLVGQRKAIVDDVSGVTRDRHYAEAEWLDKEFIVIDTGGYVKQSNDVFETSIREQVKIAISEADVLLFMVDITCGVTDLDAEFADLLRRSSKKVLVVANKLDNYERLADVAEFYSLGFEHIFPISSMTGSGTGELLDEVAKHLNNPEEDLTDLPKIAIIGRPNVGKSSLTNALLGVERNIVTDIPGTTRDSIHTHYKAFGHEFLLVDTAGIRKKSATMDNIEFYSVMRSIKAIEEADVVMLMIDATEGFQSQDQALFHLAEKNGKGIVILVNKWDLMNKDTNSSKEFAKHIEEKIAPFTDVPVLFISAKEKQRILKAIEMAVAVYQRKNVSIPTHALNEFLLEVVQQTPPPSLKGKFVKIKYVTQLKSKPQQFLLFCNLPQYVKDPYKRFIENRLREKYNYTGVPLKIYFRKK